MKKRFEVKHSKQSLDFLRKLEEKTKAKIIYNIDKASYLNDPELFKKIDSEIWEFRTLYQKNQYRLLGFWDKSGDSQAFVIVSHGFVKKTQKIPKIEIEKAKNFRKHYFDNKNK